MMLLQPFRGQEQQFLIVCHRRFTLSDNVLYHSVIVISVNYTQTALVYIIK